MDAKKKKEARDRRRRKRMEQLRSRTGLNSRGPKS